MTNDKETATRIKQLRLMLEVINDLEKDGFILKNVNDDTEYCLTPYGREYAEKCYNKLPKLIQLLVGMYVVERYLETARSEISEGT